MQPSLPSMGKQPLPRSNARGASKPHRGANPSKLSLAKAIAAHLARRPVREIRQQSLCSPARAQTRRCNIRACARRTRRPLGSIIPPLLALPRGGNCHFFRFAWPCAHCIAISLVYMFRRPARIKKLARAIWRHHAPDSGVCCPEGLAVESMLACCLGIVKVSVSHSLHFTA